MNPNAETNHREKKMWNRINSFVLMICLFAQTPFAVAQQPAVTDDWAAVKNVAAGEKLVLKLKSGKTLKGELGGVTEQDVTVLRKHQAVTQPRDQIAQVCRVVGKPAKGKYALIGAGIGAAAGAAIGQSQVKPDAEIHLMMGFLIGTGIGALVGMGWGASKRREVLIYQAK
jgi:hypothetical protein